MNILKSNRFTLIEMLIVMGILIFLAGTMIVAVRGLRNRPYIERAKAEIAMICAAIESYHKDTGRYPPDYISSDYDEDGVGGSSGGYSESAKSQTGPGEFYEFAPKDANGWPWIWNGDIGVECAGYPFRHIDFGPNGRPGGGDDIDLTPGTDHTLVNGLFPGFDLYWSKMCVTCGWHDGTLSNMEKGHNSGESAKALYDFLCRPMKGRADENGNPWPGIHPYITPEQLTIAPTGKGDGWGSIKPHDSFMLVDPWGNPYQYRGPVLEYRKFSPDGKKKITPDPPGDFRDDSAYTPSMNRNSFDLWSSGPDESFGDGKPDPTNPDDIDNDNITNWENR